MSSSLAWQPPGMQGDVVVQGIIHMGDTQQQVVRYAAIREDAAMVSNHMISSFIKEWAEWVED
eukprot:4702709-Prorocentrum_lima.AAC.1